MAMEMAAYMEANGSSAPNLMPIATKFRLTAVVMISNPMTTLIRFLFDATQYAPIARSAMAATE
jgi:hypothetical protein